MFPKILVKLTQCLIGFIFCCGRGRYLVTKRALLREEVVLESEAYLTSILPSWKKRICRGCFAAHSSRLSIKCAHPRSPQSSSSNILPCRHLLFLSYGQRSLFVNIQPSCLHAYQSYYAVINNVADCRPVQPGLVLLRGMPREPRLCGHSWLTMPCSPQAGVPGAELLRRLQVRC